MLELAKVYRSADGDEPSPALDANVLAAARRHIAQKQAIKLAQKRPSRWRWLMMPGGAVLACGVVAMLTLSVWRNDAPQAGFVQPASLSDPAPMPDKPLLEMPTSEPLLTPPAVKSGDVCAIQAAAAVDVELKRLDAAGCAASVALLSAQTLEARKQEQTQ